jgi:hypothetical protein
MRSVLKFCLNGKVHVDSMGSNTVSMKHVFMRNALSVGPGPQPSFGDIEIEDSFMLFGHFYMVYLFLIPRFGCVLSVRLQVCVKTVMEGTYPF